MMKLQDISNSIHDLNRLLEDYKASKTNQITFSTVKAESEYEYGSEEEEEDEEFDNYPFITPSERVYLQRWLANSASW